MDKKPNQNRTYLNLKINGSGKLKDYGAGNGGVARDTARRQGRSQIRMDFVKHI